MFISVDWRIIEDDSLELWNVSRGLYCYSVDDTILYIGKVDGTTVRQRWNRSAKASLWDFVENELGIFEHTTTVGLLRLPESRRFSSQILADVESLLISEIQPHGNVACKSTRISRPGVTVTCTGDWFYRQREFLDL